MTGEPESETNKGQERNPPPRARARVIVRILRALKRYETSRRRRRETETSQHQVNERMMARWTRRVGLFTAALVVVGGVTAAILWQQLGATHDEFEATHRPWIYASAELAGDLTIRSNGAIFQTKFTFHNTGKTPAIHIKMHIDALSVDRHDRHEPIVERQKRVCVPTDGGPLFTLFPDDKATTPHPILVGSEDLKISNDGAGGQESLPIYVTGCVEYQFTFDGTRHYSRFLYKLGAAIPRFYGPVITLTNGIAKRENMILEPDYTGGGWDAD
jgi:hypothetical protein